MKEEYKYGIAFYIHDRPDQLVHLVLYHEKPTSHDYFGLGVELATDEEFGLQSCADKLCFRDMTEYEIAHFAKEMEENNS
jgi:hypothetical protein